MPEVCKRHFMQLLFLIIVEGINIVQYVSTDDFRRTFLANTRPCDILMRAKFVSFRLHNRLTFAIYWHFFSFFCFPLAYRFSI